MTTQYINEPMLEMFIFETAQQIDQLEQSIINCEKENSYSQDTINEIFRIMHTMKSSAAMMLFNNISTIAHAIEDLFFFLRDNNGISLDCSIINDLVLEGVDFIKVELEKIKCEDAADGDPSILIQKIKEYLAVLNKQNPSISNPTSKETIQTKQQFYISPVKSEFHVNKNIYKAIVHFQEGCEMENIRAFTIIHNLKEITQDFYHVPDDITDNNDSAEVIKKDGFILYLKSDKTYDEMQDFFSDVIFLEKLDLTQLQNDEEYNETSANNQIYDDVLKLPVINEGSGDREAQSSSSHQNIISVSVQKLDKLMDLVGEMVIAEAMVTQNPDLNGLILDNFHKATRQLKKITGELQDIVMSIRMVPLAPTFYKMNRIVRDMIKKLNKEVYLDIIGKDTEVDKNIIEHIADPLMHLVRNAVDHGIETTEERNINGKPRAGTVTLEARNAGSEVLITVKDDGKGLNKDKILQKAKENGLLHKPEEEINDKEIFNLIFLPGFSTKDNVTEFSGRGVGMDVVMKNIEAVGGSIQVESIPGEGTTIILKIPLTLAIIDGINIIVGKSRYTIPVTSIKESFRPKVNDVIKDPDGNEMIMIRGQCYPILRIHQLYRVKTEVTNIHEGILIMVENEANSACIFADELLGEQQVVVKALPGYLKSIGKIKGLAGCTLLGDGNISLILDTADLISF